MIAKNIKSRFVALIALLTFVGCSLDEHPTTFFSEEAIYANEAGVETGINGLYYNMGSFQYYGSAYINVMLPASGLFWSSQQANVDVTGLNANASNINLVQLWESMFETINAANVAIANLEGKTDEELKNRRSALGHAYFVRGKTYLDLLRAFGGVPLRTSPADIDNLHAPRASEAAVADLIISDLEQAKMLMPEIGETLYGRPAKWAAYAYLAKLYMFLAQNDNAYWEKAFNELQPIINSQQYSLLPRYADLFVPGNENTAEALFEIQYGHTGGIRTSDLPRLFTPSNSIYAPSNTVTFGRIRPNKEVFDDHVNRYPDDPRIDATFLYDSYEKSAGGVQKIYPQQKTGNNGYAIIAKWFDPSYNGTTSERNYIVLRYADVLLMMAEVVNELEGPDNAYPFVNEVLARARDINGNGSAFSDEPAAWSGMDQSAFRERIMYERRYELLSEGEEWYDTRRRGYEYLLENVIVPHNSNTTFDSNKDFMYPDDTKNLLLPIPLSEISGNQAIGPDDQNPGY